MELWLGPGALFRNALLGGLLVAVVCSLLGVYVVLRRLVLLGVALPQAGAAGIAAAFWLAGHAHQPGGIHASALAGSLLATFAALAFLVLRQRGGAAPAEWGIGALLAIASAVTVIFVALNPSGDLEVTNLLRGDLLAIGDADLVVLAAASLVAVLLFLAFRREILLASFDPEFTRSIGREPGRADALLFALLGSAIALGVMNAGPLVVFGFLLLPALAALQLAPGLGTAFAIAAAIGALCSLGGFAVAYRADLPTGPTSVALAAGCWLAASAAARVLRRARAASRGAAALVLVLLLPLAGGGPLACASWRGAPPAEPVPLGRGSLPDLRGRGPVVVARFENHTGSPLRVPGGNPLKELQRAADPFRDPAWTVPDALQAQAILELDRRGVSVRSFDEARGALPRVLPDAASASRAARDAGLDGPVLIGSLRRFTFTQTGLLLVQLELALVDAADGAVLWTGAARRPVPVRSALTVPEILIDALPAIFAEAFGNR